LVIGPSKWSVDLSKYDVTFFDNTGAAEQTADPSTK